MITTGPYIQNPKTSEECLDNVIFQLDNVRGWMIVRQRENALTKAQCLLEDTKKLIESLLK